MERKTTQYTRQLYSWNGPTVIHMCDVLTHLEDKFSDIEVKDVRIFATDLTYRNNFSDIGPVHFIKDFRNISSKESLKRYWDSQSEVALFPFDQDGIEAVVEEYQRERDSNEFSAIESGIELVDLDNKGGSYIRFEDKGGLIEGCIKYKLETVKPKVSVHNVLVTAACSIGALCSLFATSMIAAAYIKQGEEFHPAIYALGVTTLFYVPVLIAQVKGAYFPKHYAQLETTTKSKNSSFKSIKKADDMVNFLKDTYRHPQESEFKAKYLILGEISAKIFRGKD